MKVSTVDDRWRKQFIVDLHDRWKLDPGQANVARAIFKDNKKLAVWQAGRKRGKSSCELYVLCRAAGVRGGGMFFWFAPRAKQAREIVWASNRLQTFLPKKYIKQVKSTEMRLILFNDSFIKLDGSDEYEQYRGVECDGAVYDEAKDFDYRFDTAFRPNLGPRKAFLFAAGTPPRNMVSASELGYFALVAEAKFREDGYFALAPSWDRPDPDWQDEIKKIKALYAYRASQGDEDAWNEFKCEYGGEYVEGGPGSIIPMFRMDKHVHPHERIQAELRYQSHDLEFFAIADPGNNHPFAVLFMAFDKSKPRVYFLDELYETDQAENTTGRMHPRIMEKVREFYPWPEMWRYVYDEAALWFKAHMMNSGEDPGWCQTNKAAMRSRRPNEVKPYLDVFKDALLGDDVVWISDRCQNLIREIKGYKKMEDGSIPKKGDDCLAGSTRVLTDAGLIPISELVDKNGNLHSRHGLLGRFVDVRLTHKDVPITRIRFTDGTSLSCTSRHLILRSNGTWCSAGLLVPGDRVQTNESFRAGSYQRKVSKIQWSELFLEQELFQGWFREGQTASSGRMVFPQWRYTAQDGYSPQRRELQQQYLRELRSAFAERAYKSPPHPRASSGPRNRSEKQTRRVSAESKSLAAHAGRASLAQTARHRRNARSPVTREDLRLLWQNLLHNSKPLQVLSPKLQDEHDAVEADWEEASTRVVASIENGGREDVFNLEVPELHAFAVETGVIVHNCLDCIRYGLAEAGFSFSPTVPAPTSLPSKLRSNEYSGYVEDEREDLEKLLTPSDGIIWDFSRW